MAAVSLESVCRVDDVEHFSMSPDSGFRSDSRESHSAKTPQSGEGQCDLCSQTMGIAYRHSVCHHSFCQSCQEKLCQSSLQSTCPKCQSNMQLSKIGLSKTSYLSTPQDQIPFGNFDLLCALCKTGSVTANCVQCIQLLCSGCSLIHDINHILVKLHASDVAFDMAGQKTETMTEIHRGKPFHRTSAPGKLFQIVGGPMLFSSIFQNISDGTKSCEPCQKHGSEATGYYCKSCRQPICALCATQGPCLGHEYTTLNDIFKEQTELLNIMIEQTKAKANDLLSSVNHLDGILCQLKAQFEESQVNIDKTFNFFSRLLLEHKEEIVRELKNVHATKSSLLNGSRTEVMASLMDLREAEMLMMTLLPLPNVASMIQMKQHLLNNVKELLEYKHDIDSSGLAFVSNHQAIQTAIRNTFGYVRHNQKNVKAIRKIFNTSESSTPCELKCLSMTSTPFNSGLNNNGRNFLETNSVFNQSFQGSFASELNFVQPKARPICASVGDQLHLSSQPKSQSRTQPDSASIRSFVVPQNVQATAVGNQMLDCFSTPPVRSWPMPLGGCADSDEDTSKAIVSNINPALLTRIKMEYHCKFGEFGSESGQFTEPSGVAVNNLNEILVADANNHRMQVFDRTGKFKCIIGQDGKGEGDLVYPNRLAVNMQTGDIFVTERSPTHQVQVYNQHGRFLRRFGAHILQHPRGITVDRLGRIIVVECKVMRVVIFSAIGTVINRFVIDKCVNFPNGVAVNDSEEIFISDNRRHGIVVFDYQGRFLRTIGGSGVTNYPIGVGINSVGEVIVADNHNNFNVTVFRQDGQLIRAMESRVKHAQCFDTALLGSTSIVLSSKDFRVYVYHYVTASGFQENSNQFL